MGAGTWESHHAITKLMFRYAECVDTADFDGLSQLFAEGVMTSTSAADEGGGMTGEQVGRFYAATNRVHEDGTLRTRHLATNLIVDIDEDADRATARSYYVVFQATGKLPFQAIVGGKLSAAQIRRLRSYKLTKSTIDTYNRTRGKIRTCLELLHRPKISTSTRRKISLRHTFVPSLCRT